MQKIEMSNQFLKLIANILASLKRGSDSVVAQGITSDEINARNLTSPYWIEISKKADMYRSKLLDILRKYAILGVMMGQELLLHPDDAFRLAKDLEELGIAILGFDCWYNYYGSLREDTSVEFYVGDDVIWGRDPVHDSVVTVRKFIQNQLPINTQYVSFTLHIPYAWELFSS